MVKPPKAKTILHLQFITETWQNTESCGERLMYDAEERRYTWAASTVSLWWAMPNSWLTRTPNVARFNNSKTSQARLPPTLPNCRKVYSVLPPYQAAFQWWKSVYTMPTVPIRVPRRKTVKNRKSWQWNHICGLDSNVV